MKKFTILSTTLAASTLTLSLVGGVSKAKAVSLVPPIEGEIKLTNVACVTGSCIDTAPYGYTISSESYNSNYLPSLLFSDDSATANNWGFGIVFGQPDAGTNTIAGENWFRPVALKKDGSFPENGQLEVGQYKFNFATTIAELQLLFFDTEDTGTSILSLNGNPYNSTVAPGDNANMKKVTLTNVNSLELKLGNIGGKFVTGDGVRLDINKTVPEPGTILSLGAIAVSALFGLQKRKKFSQAV
ncbi:MAG: LEVG family PEP-CTERM protein [Desmonostoc vinosum HA7617-LM4]|jgi:hypothetical protein|nr:LEVG family PEP-CTERM protein [Desmonostoc vinosum HA7617-LM4]